MRGCGCAFARIGCFVGLVVVAFGLVGLTALPAHGALLLADARADYKSAVTPGDTTAEFGGGLGLPDQVNGGHWNYGQSTAVNAADFTKLIFDTNPQNSAGNPAYRSPDHKFANFVFVPAVSNAKLFSDGSDPASNQLTWHPDGAPVAVIRWTADASEAGSIHITGAFDRTNEPTQGAPNFFIYVNGVKQYEVDAVVFNPNSPSDAIKSFDITSTIAGGQNVDFIMIGGGGGVESKLSAQITGTPEPGSAALFAVVVACLALRRHNRTRRVG